MDNLTTMQIGLASEYKVAADLMLRGFHVFLAANPQSTCDLVALKDQQVYRVEVKTARRKGNILSYNAGIVGRYDILALVLPDEIIYQPPL